MGIELKSRLAGLFGRKAPESQAPISSQTPPSEIPTVPPSAAVPSIETTVSQMNGAQTMPSVESQPVSTGLGSAAESSAPVVQVSNTGAGAEEIQPRGVVSEQPTTGQQNTENSLSSTSGATGLSSETSGTVSQPSPNPEKKR